MYSLRYSDDPLLCGALDAGVLRRSLPEMPRLYSISLHCWAVHGIRDDVAASLLSVPQIRDVHISSFLLCPRKAMSHDSTLDIPPLTSFRYTRNPFHIGPGTQSSELEAIVMVVSKLHGSLEVLKLPAETSPLDDMSQLDWPRLHQLILHGNTPNQLPIPIIAVICQMPRLRILTLEFTILPDMCRQCLWPPYWTVNNPLPQIEELTVTHPHSEDLLYTHLPTSIRRMSLCCRPCYALQLWHPDDYGRWKSPLSSASELLRILSGSSLPCLTHLGLDYSQDREEEQLLQHLSDSYPHLNSVELHRMGDTPLAWPEDTPTMVCACFSQLPRYTDFDTYKIFITHALSRLRRLEMLRLNLNISNSGAPYGDDREFFAWLRARSLEIAKVIAPMVGPSVALFSLLVPASTGARWVGYRVSDAEGRQCVVSEIANPQVRRSEEFLLCLR